jgi:hypothetical protein
VQKIKASFVKNKRILITLLSGATIVLGSLIAIQFAKGYRPTSDGTISGTGLLSATSDPQGAQIYLNGKISNKVTDDTVNMDPGDYKIEIKKEGYTTWTKDIKITQELVTETNAHLFRTVPTLTPITFSGAKNIVPSPDGQKLAYNIASPSAQQKAGLYVMDVTDRPISFSKGPRLVAENLGRIDFATAKILWSPDSQQILASFEKTNYLLNASQENPPETITNMTTTDLNLLLSTWYEHIAPREIQ